MRAVRRLMAPAMITEYNRALIAAMRGFEPDLFFAFKGDSVTPETLRTLRASGAVSINFYPDTGFDGQAAKAITLYDWVFTTKPAHMDFLRERYAYTNITFVSHAYDPEVHVPVTLTELDHSRYGCDVVFIGNISRKKEGEIAHLLEALPEISVKIWGPNGWSRSRPRVRSVYQDTPVWGQEYAKAILGAKINLGLLFEGTPWAPAGDLITARTFEIPATGGFMLHERNELATHYFADGEECAFFVDQDDMINKIQYFLLHDKERASIAEAGRRRMLLSDCSYDHRADQLISKYRELRSISATAGSIELGAVRG